MRLCMFNGLWKIHALFAELYKIMHRMAFVNNRVAVNVKSAALELVLHGTNFKPVLAQPWLRNITSSIQNFKRILKSETCVENDPDILTGCL